MLIGIGIGLTFAFGSDVSPGGSLSGLLMEDGTSGILMEDGASDILLELLIPAAPVIDLASGSDSGTSSSDDITSDTTPTISVTFDTALVASDTLETYVDNVLVDTHALSGGEAAAHAASIDLAALADGVHTVKMTSTKNGSVSPESNVLSITIDTTAPALSSPLGTETSDTTASLSVSTNTGSGTLYWVVTTASNSPSAAQVKAGQNHLGAAATASGSQAVSSTGTKTASPSGLTASTQYWAHFMHEDVAGNQSAVSSSSSFTTAAPGFILAAPVLTWDAETADTTPDFTIDFDEAVIATDVIRFQIDDDIAFGSPTEVTDTLDAAEILAGAISLAAGALADGTYYARARVERSAVPASDWSNVETVTISTGGGTAGQAIGLLLTLTKAS